jgi:hypothetical protein
MVTVEPRTERLRPAGRPTGMRNSSRQPRAGGRRRRLLPACLAVAGLTLIAACSGGGDDSTSDDAGGAQREVAERAASDQEISTVSNPDVALATERDLIKTGTIELESTDIDELLFDLDGVVATHGGIVDSEDVRTDDDGDARAADVVVRVPVDRFESAVDDIAGLATLVRVQTSSEDVTTRVADVDARVASAQRSIASLQRLFDRATKLSDVIRLESELSRRQADLESLQARQSTLARQTTLSTIRLSVARVDEASRDDDDRGGFLAGLESGWSGLVTFVRGSVHVVGLILPLGTLAALVATAVWIAVRRWRPAGRA